MKFIFSTLMLLFTIFIFGQKTDDIKIKQGPVIKELQINTKLISTERDGKNGYVTIKAIYANSFRTRVKKYRIEHFDSNFKLKSKHIIENGKKEFIKGMLIKNDSLFLIKTKYDSKSKEIRFFVQYNKLDKYKFASKNLITFNREQYKKYFGIGIPFFIISNGIEQIDFDTYGYIKFSKNKKYFVLSFDINNKEKETHFIAVFDDRFNKKYQTKFQRNIYDRYFDYADLDIDNQGNVYILGQVYENNSLRVKKRGKPNYHYELFKISKDGQKNVSFKKNDKYISTLKLLHKNDKLFLTGYYSDKSNGGIKGICFYKYTDDLTLIKKSFQEINFSKKETKDRYNRYLRSIFIDKEDNVFLISEVFYIKDITVFQQGRAKDQITPYYVNLMISKLNKDGKLLWTKFVYKLDSSPTHISTLVNGNIYIFLIATKTKVKKKHKNIVLFKSSYSKNHSLFAIKFDKNGKFSYKKLIDTKKASVNYNPAYGLIDIDNNAVILLGKYKKKQRTAIIKIK